MKKIIVIVATVLLMASVASASVIYDLNVANSGPGGTAQNVPTVATVELSQVNTQTVHFDIKMIVDVDMRNFYFNSSILTLTSANIINITTDPSSIGYTVAVNYDHLAADGFGKFDISLDKTGQHNVTELQFDVFIAGGASLGNFIQLAHSPAGNGYGHFAAQILAPGAIGANTYFVRDNGTPHVAEPSMLWLFGSGLLGLGLFRFKK